MPTPSLTKRQAEEAVNALQSAVDGGHPWPGIPGHPSAIAAAAKAMGIPAATLRSRVTRATERFGLTVTPHEPEPIEVTVAPVRPRVRVKAASSRDDAPVYRVFAMGDAHDGPNLPDKSRFKWLARHAAETRPDRVIQIGDFATFDSLSRHDHPGSLPQKIRPSYARDMESLEEALAIFYKELDDGIACDVTLGNHERRVQKFEEGTAEIEGALWQPLLDLFARYRWRTHDEGRHLFIGGVSFVHAPRTIMNREYGGKTLNPIANDAMHSIVFGHSHRGQVLTVPKIGDNAQVTILNLGTCLPTGYIAQYAKVATTGWSYGAWDLAIQSGRIIGHQFHSMDALEARYGD
jgi:hypothetical protein